MAAAQDFPDAELLCILKATFCKVSANFPTSKISDYLERRDLTDRLGDVIITSSYQIS
jgi:hypothetical protein